MKTKRPLKVVVPVLAAIVFMVATLTLAAEIEPIEYQASVNIDALLNEVHSSEAPLRSTDGHFANATSASDVRAGMQIYKVHCGSCHGRQLQGQALWQAQDAYAGLRAPPHDSTGHTWQHSDEELFRKVRNGRFAELSDNSIDYELERHAFRSVLSDESILRVLAFIKARWPLGIRVAQSTLNPQFQGMPPDAEAIEWTFPPTCLSSR